jgi:hypothetical protein
MILLGRPDDNLISRIPALLTVLHQRIDLLVGTSTAVSTLGPDFRRRWRVAHTFLFPEGKSTELDRPAQTWITDDVDADLGNGISLGFFVTSRNAWNATGATQHLWMITVATRTNLVTLTPDSSSAEVLAADSAVLLVVPNADVERLLTTRAPAAIAINARYDLGEPFREDASAMLVRIYGEDIARFEIREDGIALPTWAEGST